jgi:hypothetical protein
MLYFIFVVHPMLSGYNHINTSMKKYSPTNQEKLDLLAHTLFLDDAYSKVNFRQRKWHVDNCMELTMCDTCGQVPKRWDIAKKAYGRFCSSKCAHAHPDVTNRTKATCMERYGSSSNLNSALGIKKTQESMIAKYGVDHPAKSKDIRNKTKDTLMQQHGVDCALQIPSAVEKTLQTNLARYGVSHHLSSESVRHKIKETNLQRYGVENPGSCPEIQKKKKATLKASNGIINVSQLKFSEEAKEILFNKTNFIAITETKSLMEIANQLGVDRTTVMKYATSYGVSNDLTSSSYLECEMTAYLDSIGVTYIRNCRTLIAPYEIDIFLPKYNLAIEMNGDYWHSDRFRDHRYHQDKWQTCVDNNIKLIQVNESDWNNARTKVMSLIMSSLGMKSSGAAARKCNIIQVESDVTREFMDRNHLQGYVVGTSNWGAYDPSGKLVGVMVFGWTRGSKLTRRFELKRWALDGESHAGLFSKVFRHAHTALQFDTVVSFSQNNWFDGNLYHVCGFEKIGVTRPAYSYVVGGERYHASHYTRKRIENNHPDIFMESMTEREMMRKLGHRIWDSGKTEWIWRQ